MYYNTTPRLTDRELADLVGWFENRMSQEDRADLIAERPTEYAKLHPGVDPAVIAAAVTRGVNRIRAAQAADAEAAAAQLTAPVTEGEPR
jgi:hypothetical protein